MTHVTEKIGVFPRAHTRITYFLSYLLENKKRKKAVKQQILTNRIAFFLQ